MLWHGGVALKQIEKDVESKLGFSYVRKAKVDSKICDLMISGCRMHTELINNKFWYKGEVLEEGLPRNDIFFHKERHQAFREHVCKLYNIPADSHIVLYAPTFRRNESIEPYRINWDRVRPALKRMLGSEDVTVIVRMHPNLINKVDTSSLVDYEGVVDGTRYHDMQELLCVSDLLITDYSSSMFDFSMQGKPCMLYATDVEEYDRGYYFDFTQLPYPLARNVEEFIAMAEGFDVAAYEAHLGEFFAKEVGLVERGVAAQALAEWIVKRSRA
jgi:CDP-glycerol glycerophosphotransferase